ncbi:MAG: mannose-1-phosphate guanylyltransferase/mannose-6-phosphate isomerase [Pseudomonadales bacterium]|nr:mannose-1-phosphate guanylyltransferase/mannose-6-phosphate isomerase [Pseudomonadales bacterium]MDG2078328.1 mannose-1-phosphate guanylyltransferase/mannose-6-phosphate isomerase [Pseudomonadales bacterium]
MIIPVILCGGSGTRLWPLSRKAYPKQFIDLTGSGRSMLQETWLRLQGVPDLGAAVIMCNAENRFLVAQQMQDIGADLDAVILEPCAKNTAPAVTCAALHIAASNPDATMLVLPADHLITNEAALHESLLAASAAAEQSHLVTFGVVPTHAETGYGYIRKTEPLEGLLASGIEEFVEKPDLATAQQYLAGGNYLWNSGMFMFKAARYLEEIGEQAPTILDACKLAVDHARRDLDFTCLDDVSFNACPEDSIDYAVMEKASARAVVDLDAGWSDVGSWSSLWDVKQKDSAGNVSIGDVVALDTADSYVHSEHRLVATLGINNAVIIETADAVLVADRDRVQDVKAVVSQLKSSGRDEGTTHKIVYRPWGSYETICLSERFQVKKIIVTPGHKLSLQKHHHRAEHWIVVAGTAQVTCEDEVFTLSEDQSTYIPLGHKHRLENKGKIPLELIEVQTGSYLGEDDIVRYDDVYGRDT